MVPELKLDGVRFRVYRGGEERAVGDAATITLRRDSSEIAARDLSVLLPQGGASGLRISAPAGEGVLASRTFSAWGGVVLSRGEDVARTERARFEPEGTGGVVRGDDPVVVEGRGYRLTGVGFTLDPASGDIAVSGPARLVAGNGSGR